VTDGAVAYPAAGAVAPATAGEPILRVVNVVSISVRVSARR